MSATTIDGCRDFITAVQGEACGLDAYIHPSAAVTIGHWLGEARDSFEDPAVVACLLKRIRAKLAQELRFSAENEAAESHHG